MKHDALQQAAEYTQRRRRRRRWQKVVTCLAAVVVFCTTYALILPAITMEKSCEIPEHTHTEACYTQVTDLEKKVPVCTVESLNIHQHTESCYNSDHELVCGYADFVIHQHDSSCYDADGNLWCPLPIIEAHTHDDSCWTTPETEPAHEHTDECYEWEQGETLICGQEEREGHIHSEEAGCYLVESTLICQVPESDGHRHEEACYDENGELICGQTEGEGGHAHGEGCYQLTKTLICEIPEDPGHQHTSDCYAKVRGELSCTEPTETEPVEPVLTCEKEEIIPHEHTSDCFDEDGNLICGKIQILEHRHTDACFETVQEPVDTEALTCGLTEGEGAHTHSVEAGCYDENGELICQTEESIGHQHSALCYGTWELTCNMEEHVHSEECTSVAVDDEPEPSLLEETVEGVASANVSLLTDNTPIAADNFVSDAYLYYRNDSTADWAPVTEETILSGDAELKLKAQYAEVPLSDLVDNGGIMQFTIPGLLRDPIAEGTITDEGGEPIGTASVDGSVLTIDFSDTWLQEQSNAGNSLISGSFFVTSTVNTSGIGTDGKAELVLGNVTIIANFEEDVDAKEGTVTLTKSVAPKIVEEAGGSYAEYTLKVTAGDSPCPQVKVIDTFTANQDYVSYVGITEVPLTLTTSGTPGETIPVGKTHGSACLDSNGNMVWEIGDMGANESRTLTYRVKLADGYTYIQNSDEKLISNEAQAYSKQYPKDSANADLEPKANLSLKKTASNPVENEDGSYTITYTVVAEAYKSNSFTLDNVYIEDSLNAAEGVLPYISYVADSFRCYPGTNTSGTPQMLKVTYGENSKSFRAELGDMAPGSSYCVQYQVRVEREALGISGGVRVDVNNKVNAYADNAKQLDYDYLGTSEQSKWVQYSHWAKKLVGEALSAEQEVPISGVIYDATGETPEQMDSAPESFTAPAGSYLYTVLVNEKGDWDVTSASMTDRIDGSYMQFVGYVKVEALDTENGSAVVGTIWVKVDGNTDFNFTMQELGLKDNRYAYRLSYYAEPKVIEGTAAVVVRNGFTLSGTIIPGTGDPFVLTGVTATKDVVLKGGNTITTNKMSWYYEGPVDTTGNYKKGTIYWAIRVSGDSVPAGTYIQDYFQTGGTYIWMRPDAFVGIYTSGLSESAFTSYPDIQTLLDSGNLEEVDSSYYSVETIPAASTSAESTTTVKMERTLPLDGKNMYIVIKTAPAWLPNEFWFGDTVTYGNYLRTSDDGKTWTDRGRAQETVYQGTNLLKKVGAVFRYNGESIQETVSGSASNILQSELGEPGMFISWEVRVNYAGDLSGQYRLEDTLPDGVELTYVRVLSRGAKVRNSTAPEIWDLGADFAEYTTTAKPSGESTDLTTYYYSDGETVIWDVDNLVATKAVNTGCVTFQIVCRVTDRDVLLGGQTKEFNNTVTLYTPDGREHDVAAQTAQISVETLKKTVAEGGRTLPFTITVNDLGEDLLEGASYLTVVDTLSDSLKLDPTSIAVANTETGASVPFDASVDGNTVYITIPDNQPLTITYKAKVLSKPGEACNVRNDAHWEGYASTEGGSVEIKNYAYTVGGTAGGTATPKVEIVKYDSSSVRTYLSGAHFRVVEGTMENGTFTQTPYMIWEGVTDNNGVLVLGNKQQLMKYNTVYRITETEAPEGFVLDSTPIYFIVAQPDENGSYPDYPDGVDVWYESDVYECRIGNSRGTASVTKRFEDAGESQDKINGTYRFGIFDTENPVGQPIQSVSITFASGVANSDTATFTGLELGKEYFIYELDDKGKAIADGQTAQVDQRRFTVTYSNGPGVTIAADGTSTPVVITNAVSYPELPATGGAGTYLYTAGGALLMTAAGILLYIQNKRRKEETASS